MKYVFDTHHHGDHLYGNPVWTQAGATTLAFSGVAQELKRLKEENSKLKRVVADLTLDNVVLKDLLSKNW